MYKLCALIPTYNHHKGLPEIIKELPFDVLIINDGSSQNTRTNLSKLDQENKHVSVIHSDINMGKGAAIQRGILWAKQQGYTHVFQIDADGQHDLRAVQAFVSASQNNPHALVTGYPQYDHSIPYLRKFGRWMTNVWVWVETLSLSVKESMCGFRIYPVQETLNILQTHKLGSRMEFDIEILVRLFWHGTPSLMLPVKVTYPQGNSSTFHMFWDNFRITKMHTRLVFEMVFKLPVILKHRPNIQSLDLQNTQNNWFNLKEIGGTLGLKIMLSCYCLLGRKLSKIIALPVLFYYFISSHERRQASQEYLSRVFITSGKAKKPSLFDVFKHYLYFLEMMLDKFGAWAGRIDKSYIDADSVNALKELSSQDKGGLFLTSHLGNIDILRACASFKSGNKLIALLHSKNAENFNHLLSEINPKSAVNTLEVSQIGPDSIIYLKQKIKQGYWVAIAADRVPLTGESRVSHVPFLGLSAPFPQGAYILASLLGCPVYCLTIVRVQKKFKVYIEKLANSIQLNKSNRNKDIEKYARSYSNILEKYCIEYPYQWFNFYSFWKPKYA